MNNRIRYTVDEVAKNTSYQIPKFLFTEEFKKLNNDVRILYSLLLDRMSLSAKNGWVDDQGRLYVIYTADEIKEDLNCGREKAVKSMQELVKIGLVEIIRQAVGKSNRIYIKKIEKNERNEENV